jgi:hypothetical protein
MMTLNVPERAVFGFDTHQISAIDPAGIPAAKPLGPWQRADFVRHGCGPAADNPFPSAMDHSPARDTLTDADEGLVPALLLALTEQT